MLLQIKQNMYLFKKKLNELSKKKKGRRRNTNKRTDQKFDKNLVFLMEQNIFLMEYFKII